MFAYSLGALCPVRFITWLVVGFSSSSLFKSRFILWSLLTTAYLGLLSESETVMSEDRNGLQLELGHVYMVEVDLRKACLGLFDIILSCEGWTWELGS